MWTLKMTSKLKTTKWNKNKGICWVFPHKTLVSPEIIIQHTNNKRDKTDDWEVEAFQNHSHMDPWGPISVQEGEVVDVLLAADCTVWACVCVCQLGGGPSALRVSLCLKYKQSGQLQQWSTVICHATASSTLSAQHTHTSSRESEVSAWLYLVPWALAYTSSGIKGCACRADQTQLTDQEQAAPWHRAVPALHHKFGRHKLIFTTGELFAFIWIIKCTNKFRNVT